MRVIKRSVPIARRNLLADRARLLISIGGVTLSVVLILVVQSLYQGFSSRLGELPERLPVDVWVSSVDAPGFTYKSVTSTEQLEAVREVEGVGAAFELHGGRYRLAAGERTTDVYLLAFHVPALALEAFGVGDPAPGEIVLDRLIAEGLGLSVGDRVETVGLSLRVTGVEDIAGAGVASFALISVEDAQRAIVPVGYASYILVSTQGDPAAVAARIEAEVSGVSALTGPEFSGLARSDVTDTFLPIIRVLLWVSFAIGVAFVGIVTYTATVERSAEYGVLKALGAENRELYRIVLTQSLAVGLAGFAVGAPLARAINVLAARVAPSFITLIRWQDLAEALAFALGMAVLASAGPARRVARIDPAAVFRA